MMVVRWAAPIVVAVLLCAATARADYPHATLSRVYPPGGQRGSTFVVELQGSSLEGCEQIRVSHDGINFKHVEGVRFEAQIEADVPVGLYDIQAITRLGVSSTRAFFVSQRGQKVEEDPAESADSLLPAEKGEVRTGCIGAPGDVDSFEFAAASGDMLIIECWAERIDSVLRATLELHGPDGRRVAVNRGFFGKDPLIAYRVPESGRYLVKLTDLVFSGSGDHFYRLDIHDGPRVVFTMPSVVQWGVATNVQFFGWNLSQGSAETIGTAYDSSIEKVLAVKRDATLPLYRPSAALSVDGISHHLRGTDTPTWIQATSIPVAQTGDGNVTPGTAFPIQVPVEIGGRLSESNQPAWYSLQARRGEVFHLEAFAARSGSPVDLTVNILSSSGEKILASFTDVVPNLGDLRFPTAHLDPAGRWTAPSDGRYLIAVRDVTAGLAPARRRVFRLCVQRETSPFDVVAVGRRAVPSNLSVRRGGRGMYDLIAVRRCGFDGNIQVRAVDLPGGLSCPDVWFGPGVSRVPLVLSAERGMKNAVGSLRLLATTRRDGGETERVVLGGTMVRTGLPNGSGRIANDIPWAVAGDSPVRLTANADRSRYSQGSIVEIEVFVDRGDKQPSRSVRLSGIGLPPTVDNRLGDIPANQKSSYISFFLPASMPVGNYTIAVSGATRVLLPEGLGGEEMKEVDVDLVSNPVNFTVYPAPYVVRVNLDAPTKIRRGEVIQLQYTAVRKNGFIGKIHTDIAAPGGVRGIRARGVTFVGQIESGVLQVIANIDAPLGQQRGLRIQGVGTIEDEPVHLGSCFLKLEIIE
jgi:hypothetical protein